MVGGSSNKVVATLRADGKIFTNKDNALNETANLMNYKIRVENEVKYCVTPSVVVDQGKQLLQFARDSDLIGVKAMLSRGAPFTSDWLGMSALHFGAMNNQYEMCEILLHAGINKDAKTKVDRTPLHLAAYYGNESIVKLLLSKNCFVNGRDMLCMTPLHWAVEKRHKNIVRLLLKHNADASVPSKFGKTPIALAVITEQADLLEELEASRKAQLNEKQYDNNERETSEAVKSIICLKDENKEEIEHANKEEIDTEDDLTNASEYSDATMADLGYIKETGTLDDSTVNLLKSHGISMLQDDDDASKDLLTTALQNGRQLILSEGGKLLLNEAKRAQNNNNNTNNNNNNKISNNNNNNNVNKIVPIRVKPGAISPVPTAVNKTRQNLLSKAKDNPGIGRNKNIRIISLNDFKKLYGNSNVKSMQNLSAVSSSQLAMQLSENATSMGSTRKVFISRQKTQGTEDDDDDLIEEDMPLAKIIKTARTDSEPDEALSDTEPPSSLPAKTERTLSDKRDQYMSTMQVRSVSAVKPQMTKNISKQTSPVMPLLTTTEICRQLFELRKQNEDLRRKYDTSQRENEEMRQRLDRLEEFLLVERTDDDDYTDA